MAPPRFGIVFLPELLDGFGDLCREAEAQLAERHPADR